MIKGYENAMRTISIEVLGKVMNFIKLKIIKINSDFFKSGLEMHVKMKPSSSSSSESTPGCP